MSPFPRHLFRRRSAVAATVLVAVAATVIGGTSAVQAAAPKHPSESATPRQPGQPSRPGRPDVQAPKSPPASSTGGLKTYVVVAQRVQDVRQVAAAVRARGGRVTGQDRVLGVLTATSTRSDFAARVTGAPGVEGVAVNQFVARVSPPRPGTRQRTTSDTTRSTARTTVGPPDDEPLAAHQRNLRLIHATRTGSYAVERGRRSVLVGVLDTGIDGSHPDINTALDRRRSRNFVTDVPALDGRCEHRSCVDPVDEDDNGHGTQAAGLIAAPLNKVGIGGVAPGVTLVNLRVGQDSGYVFLLPVLNALRYAADIGVDVVNMSFVVDPWVFACRANAKDSRVQQSEQRAILTATGRALEHAHRRGVTLVAALGNSSIDLDRPGIDPASPTFPETAAHDRTLGRDCRTLPAEGPHVIGVSSIGLSRKKAYYSNFGGRATDLSAPGGSNLDFFGTPGQRDPDNVPLAPFPRALALANADPKTGVSVDPSIVTKCTGTTPATCSYWKYEQGTSFAAPLVAGVAALVVSRYGTADRLRPGLRMSPDLVERRLRASATRVACPSPVVSYVKEGLGTDLDARCTGTARQNSIYGAGIVDARRAVSGR